MKQPLPSPLTTLALLTAFAAAALDCAPSEERLVSTAQLVVTLCDSSQPGCANNRGGPTLDQRLPISFTGSQAFKLRVEAHKGDGSLDTGFNGYVRASIKPGTVLSVTTPPGGAPANGRNVQLQNGVADNVSVEVVGAYGDSRIWMEDMGYVPADPARVPPPQCANGKDDNLNGKVDFPVDPGCAFANDDTEDNGTYAAGATDTLYYLYPRVADVRGVTASGAGTPFPHEQVQIDTQWFGTTAATPYGVVVTRVASDGFYVTDLGETRGFSSVFAYNYTAPPRMRVCDRLISFGGTASDFFGFTEIGFPTWILEEWSPIDMMHPDPSQRACLVPEPFVLLPNDIASTTTLLNAESALSRVGTNVPDPDLAGQTCDSDATCATLCAANARCAARKAPLTCAGGACAFPTTLHVAKHFGAAFVPSTPPVPPATAATFTTTCDTPTCDASNCDFNRDGKIEFTGGDEQACSTACTADVDCSEYSQYVARSEFRLVIVQTDPKTMVSQTATIFANASTSASFDPVASKGATLQGFTGTLRYFSGGAQFTIESRCDDDIVVDPAAHVLPSSQACVHARTISDTNTF